MDERLFRRLLEPDGQRLIAAAAAGDLSERGRLGVSERLRRFAPADLATAALETAVLRERARAKFSRADALYATREALEQATSETVARHRAGRFAGYGPVADLGCGIGGDALALAAVTNVIGVDRDGLRLRMARENARAYGVEGRTTWLRAEIADGGPVRVAAAFVDPARRSVAGGRTFDVRAYQPPLAEVLGWRARFELLAVKVAPGIPDEAVAGSGAEVEFVALGDDLKEAVLWFGAGITPLRRATLLPSGAQLFAERDQPCRVAGAGAVLYEPNAAVIRAHLIGLLAHALDGWQIDPSIAYLCADSVRPTPFARAWLVETVLPFSVDGVRRYLRARAVGRVTVKKRGSPLEPESFARMLHLKGSEERTVVLTRQQGRHVAIICAARSVGADDREKGRTNAALWTA